MKTKKNFLIHLYNNSNPRNLGKETLDDIGRIVRNIVVRNVKFIRDENNSGLTKEAIESLRKFPSFWKPDLTTEHSLQNDIFKQFPDLNNGSLESKVEYWLGMREKVLTSIRGHRNATQTSIQSSIVEGMLYICKKIQCK